MEHTQVGISLIAICRELETLFSRPLFVTFMTKGLVRPSLSRQAVRPHGRRVRWLALQSKSNSAKYQLLASGLHALEFRFAALEGGQVSLNWAQVGTKRGTF